MPVVTAPTILCLPAQIYSFDWCCKQGSHPAPMSGVSSASADEKPAMQQPGAGDTPSNQKASQLLECIVISDSDEESSHVVGRTRSMSVGHSDASSSDRGDAEEQTRNMSSGAAAMLPVQPIRQPISSRKTTSANMLPVNHTVAR